MVANFQAVRQFDVLIREDSFEAESDKEDDNGVLTVFTRLCIDFDKGRCFVCTSGKNSVKKEQLELAAICIDKKISQKLIPGTLVQNKGEMRALLNELRVPDIRCLSLDNFSTSFESSTSESRGFEYLASLKSKFAISPSMTDLKKSIREEESHVVEIFQGPSFSFRFRSNIETLMPESVTAVRDVNPPWRDWVEEYEWEEYGGIFVPREISREEFNPPKPEGETPRQGSRIRLLQLHWFSVNEKLDDIRFEESQLSDLKALRRSIDPELLGLDRLK